MRGKHDIEVYNKRVHYFLSVRRNLTILQGDSATGKSELVRLVSQWESGGASSGITLICDVACAVLGPVDWEHRWLRLQGSIVFIDEHSPFVQSHRFAELACKSDNYFIIIYRDRMPYLPYDTSDVCGLRIASQSQECHDRRRVCNEAYRLFSPSVEGAIVPEYLQHHLSAWEAKSCRDARYP